MAPGLVVQQVDVADPGECTDAVAATVAEFGALDVLGNIAGIARAEHFPEVEERLPPDDGRERRCLLLPRPGRHPPPARERRQHREHRVERRPHGSGVHGRVLHDQGRDRAAPSALAMEYAKQPLRVNAIDPAGSNTNIGASTQLPADVDHRPPRADGRSRGGWRSREEVAALFAFLASDEARSISRRRDLHARQRPHRGADVGSPTASPLSRAVDDRYPAKGVPEADPHGGASDSAATGPAVERAAVLLRPFVFDVATIPGHERTSR